MTEHATLYREAATAPGAWAAALYPPQGTTLSDAMYGLLNSCGPDAPINAAICDGGDILVTRHPSITYGTPGVWDCVAASRRLAASTGWSVSMADDHGQLLVPMGLRDGYAEDAVVSTVEEAERLLRARGADCSVVSAHLMSARRVSGRLHTYAEPGVVITSNHPGDLEAITAVADSLGQQQIVVTDFAEDRTYSLHRTGE